MPFFSLHVMRTKELKQDTNILASIIPLSILFVLVQLASLVGLFQFSFATMERYTVRKNLNSCVDAMRSELERIGGVAFEWSAWDDTALFAEGKNPDYIKNNIADSTLQEQKLNVLSIIDSQGNPLWTRCTKDINGKSTELDLSMFAPDNLKKSTALWHHNSPDNCIAGYYSTEGGVLMLSSRPITNSSNSLPIRGAVIMGRFISDDILASIARQECLDFQWWNLRSEYTRDSLQKYLSRITNDNPIYIESNPRTATAYTVLPDINGKDAILIKFIMTNEISPHREGLLIKCISIFAAEALVFILYLAAFINKHCVQCRRQLLLDSDDNSISFEQMAESQSQTTSFTGPGCS